MTDAEFKIRADRFCAELVQLCAKHNISTMQVTGFIPDGADEVSRVVSHLCENRKVPDPAGKRVNKLAFHAAVAAIMGADASAKILYEGWERVRGVQPPADDLGEMPH